MSEPLKLYRISQNENNDWDTYDSAIVAAENEDDARRTWPGEYGGWESAIPARLSGWCSAPELVNVELVGTAAPGVPVGVVLASFNAG
jgi:hypothetical protein